MDIPLLIREPVPGDLDVIVEFNTRIARETENKTLAAETLRAGVRALADDAERGRYFVACVEDRVVGQLMLTTEWSDWRNGTWWWIQSVYVHPEFRGRGVFRALFEHVEQQARECPGVVGVRLYVHRDNSAAQQVYQRLGMQDAGYVVFEREMPTPP